MYMVKNIENLKAFYAKIFQQETIDGLLERPHIKFFRKVNYSTVREYTIAFAQKRKKEQQRFAHMQKEG